MIDQLTVEGFSASALVSPAGELEAAFVPEAGMVGCSLRHRGEELLGQRRGLGAYVAERGTMGIPLLHPWANRLARDRFRVAGREVALDSPSTPVSRDPNGLAIHGLLAAASGWRVERHEPLGEGALLVADFDFGARRRADGGVSVSAPVEPRGEAHRCHPDHRHHGSGHRARRRSRSRSGTTRTSGFRGSIAPNGRSSSRSASAFVSIPRCSPPGSAIRPRWHPVGSGRGPSTTPSRRPGDAAPFVLSGGGRRIEVAFETGYPYAQVYAPADDDVIAIEPMTAPTNALVSGGPDLVLLAPGELHRATFSITVTAAG